MVTSGKLADDCTEHFCCAVFSKMSKHQICRVGVLFCVTAVHPHLHGHHLTLLFITCLTLRSPHHSWISLWLYNQPT